MEIARGYEGTKEAFTLRMVRKVEGFFTSRRDLIRTIHWVMFFIFIILLLIPPLLPYPPEEATALNNFTLFANFLFWGLWFPLVLLSTIIFGRAWCGILCPQGALSEYASRKGLGRIPPRWLRWEGTPILSFVFVTILGQLVGVRDYPLPMVEIFGGTMVLALITGLLFTKGHRTWCRYLCPIGLLLGIFSRLGMVNFEGRLVRKGEKGWNTLCPTFIDLSRKQTSRHCIECFKCANWRNPNAMRLSLRRPGQELEGISGYEPSLYEVLFLFGATGLALGAFYWQASPLYIQYKMALGRAFLDLGLGGFIGKSGPWWIMVNYPEAGEVFNYLDLIGISTFMILTMVLALAFLSLITISSTLSLGGSRSRGELFVMLGYIYAPVALISIVTGLGAELFEPLPHGRLLKGVLISLGALWSLHLSYRIIKRETGRAKVTPLVLHASGIVALVSAWYRVIV